MTQYRLVITHADGSEFCSCIGTREYCEHEACYTYPLPYRVEALNPKKEILLVTEGGKMINLYALPAEMLTAEYLISQLSRIPRYCARYAPTKLNRGGEYTVLHHAKLLKQNIAQKIIKSPEAPDRELKALYFRVWSYLHDAAEVFTGDMISPVKVLCPAFIELEQSIQDQVWKAHGLSPLPEYKAMAKYYDEQAAFAEMNFLFGAKYETSFVMTEPVENNTASRTMELEHGIKFLKDYLQERS